MPNIKYSPLHSLHLKNKAKFIEFAGWTMPFSYKGTIKEHQFVRQNSGYFDVSHMGRLLIDNDYLQKVSSLICSDLLGLKSGKALYSLFTNEKGSALDDVIFWKYDDYVLLICNAANTGKITNYLQTEDILYQDLTEQTALIAVQGPEAISNLEALLPIPDSFSCLSNDIYTYARTGYTGEDGLEIMVNVEELDELISFLLHNEIEPCGLGARDTLRLEAALPLYGFELTEDISPVEAGLKWTLTNKGEYKGSHVIDEQIKTGNHKVLKKFVIDSRNIARTGTKVKAGNINGIVTSGNFSPILQKSIGFVLLESQPDTDLLEFEIRGKFIEGKIFKKEVFKLMFVPHSSLDLNVIFDELDISSLDELFKHIPDDLLIKNGLDVEDSLSELEATKYFEDISNKNKNNLICFAGGGHYDVYLPPTVKSLTMRPEFMTSYTPYQAEISQGILQVLFEFQSLVCDLTEMELANASLYDGATSVAEAISVAINKTKRDSVIISNGFNPNTKEVVNTLIDNSKFDLNYIPLSDYLFPEDYEFTDEDAAFVVSFPHYEGSAQDLSNLVKKAQSKGVITICYVDPSMLGVLKTPGSMGFDIVVAEGQSIGTPLSFGGPTVGWFATKKDLARLVPGRIIGETIDNNHKKTYVMTLRAREQDIRREKASSNICTNQTLNAIGSAIHLSWMGPEGIYQVGYQAIQKAIYMKSQLIEKGFNVINDKSSLREFIVETTLPAKKIISEMGNRGFLAGIEYSENLLLVALTEKRTKDEIDNYVQQFSEVNHG